MPFLALDPTDAARLLTTFGTAGVFLVLFAGTGLLIGFFLPGDSLPSTVGPPPPLTGTARVEPTQGSAK